MNSVVVVVAVASLLLEMLPGPVRTQVSNTDPPYEVVVLGIEEDSVTLECRVISSQFLLANSSFYRNGVREGSDDPCLPGRSSDGVYTFPIKPECDGQYYCGAELNGGLVLSAAQNVYGI